MFRNVSRMVFDGIIHRIFFNSIGYGVGMPEGTPYKQYFDDK